ncbi:MAG: hypothetical protein C0483_16440 [Pirellula sp.]|nr:hypothetical protein [Pirellula sp.]
MPPLLRFCTAIVVAICIVSFAAPPARAAIPLGYNADVRGILSDKCFRCHGPDSAARQGDLRLDQRADAVADRGGTSAIVPGDPKRSEAYLRIVSQEAGERMPPDDSGLSLSEKERELIRQWIAEGANYESHWSFVPPVRPELPKPVGGAAAAHPIDRFIDERLAKLGVSANPEADPAVLCRRLHLDLTGLPPTIAEVEQFLAAYASTKSAAAREKAYVDLVDRLLASPRYAEQMASPWLDAARYADTNGYQTDGPRRMWRWRDWVIDAFRRNQPFDEFTVEQLAGDLLPQPTLEQQIATGFHRNHRMNAEGGIIPEEYLAEYVADRVETTGTVWLGLTIGCARCHDHKYDPITQREFYQLFDFFNRVPEPGKALRDDNSPPTILAPTDEQQVPLAKLEQEVEQARKVWVAAQPEVERSVAVWAAQATRDPARWTITDGLTLRIPFDETLPSIKEWKPIDNGGGRPSYAPGPFTLALQLDGRGSFEFDHVPKFDSEATFSAAVWLRPPAKANATVYAAMDDAMSQNGIELRLVDGRPQVVLSGRILDDVVRVEAESPLPADLWSHVAWTYDGTRDAAGVHFFIDGRPVKTRVVTDTLSNKFKTTRPLVVGAGGTSSNYQGRIADLRFYDRALSADEAAIVYCDLSIRAMAQEYGRSIDPAVGIKLREYFLRFAAPEGMRRKRDAEALAEEAIRKLRRELPTTMVMRDVPGLRTTHVLTRGEYDKPGEAVKAGIPAAFGLPLPSQVPPNRLALARWLVDRRHPLTARVAVNRFWQQLFGVGLVKTVDDFGVQGEWPIYHELLDWLAVEFMEAGDGWDVKHLVKQIVTSAAYRRSSQIQGDAGVRDPENRLLARGARFRLSAEAVRDSALAVSGLLTERIGGPSIKPYQPAGLWEELATGVVKYEQDHGEDLYRRSLYIYRKRTVSVPMLSTFDAAARETCVVRQSRTNTPLQSLNLLNDVTFVEASRALGARMMRESSSDPAVRIAHGFQLVTARGPTPDELRVLVAGFERRFAQYQADPASAVKLVAIGESPVDKSLDVVLWAVYTTVGNVLLNLDEFVTRE